MSCSCACAWRRRDRARRGGAPRCARSSCSAAKTWRPQPRELDDIDGPGEHNSDTGDLDIFRDVANGGASGSKTVVIDLNTETVVSDFSTNDEDRVFDIPASESALTVTIRYGNIDASLLAGPVPDRGGCIRVLAGTLNLTSITLDDCHAYHDGGAVYAVDAFLNIDGSTFSSNSVPEPDFFIHYGGAISARDTFVEIVESTFDSNAADWGGAIYLNADVDGTYLGGLDMEATTVESNKAFMGGGGLALFAPFAIDDSTIAKNEALDGVARGAGMYVHVPEDSVSIVSSSVDDNFSALDGGGIYVDETEMWVELTSISGNYDVTGDGGGIAADGATLSFLDCGFADNVATDQGGGIALRDTEESGCGTSRDARSVGRTEECDIGAYEASAP